MNGRLGWGGLTLAVALIGVGCEGKKEAADKDNAPAGCQKDTDCKGDRVCVAGECASDTKAGAPKAKGAPSSSAKAVPAKAKPKAAGPTFAPVKAEVYNPRLGPKMKAGSEIAHTVFEGPFGPSPKSLFAITKRKDATFYVLVMGEDGKGWPAGPLAEPGVAHAHEVQAVSFFDADGNGTTDALVMATYISGRGGKAFNVNVLLKWTDLGMRRLLKLEPKIENLKSVAAVKKALGR